MANIHNFKSPFVVVPDRNGGNGTYIEAEVELPSDGTPDMRNYLVVQVSIDPDNDQQAIIRVINRIGKKNQIFTEQLVAVSNLGDLLYGVARVKTKYYLDLI